MTSSACPLPPGYTELHATTGFTRRLGALFLHERDPILAVRVNDEHLNTIQIAHGGFLATLADSAIGAVMRRAFGLPVPPVTASLSIDYLGAVHAGDWLEAHVDVLKRGRQISNASCMLRVGERAVLRASGVFVMPR